MSTFSSGPNYSPYCTKDIVQNTFLIAAGVTLEEIGLIQDNIVPRGVAMQW